MSLSLPTANSSLRDLFNVADLVEWRALPNFRQALASAGDMIASGADSAQVVCRRADGQVWLVKVGPKGGWKRLWNFGCPTN
jgi:hypothetical protein